MGVRREEGGEGRREWGEEGVRVGKRGSEGKRRKRGSEGRRGKERRDWPRNEARGASVMPMFISFPSTSHSISPHLPTYTFFSPLVQ